MMPIPPSNEHVAVPAADDLDTYFTVVEIADLLKVHTSTVRRWIRDGDLAAKKIGGRVRVTRSGLRAFVKSSRY